MNVYVDVIKQKQETLIHTQESELDINQRHVFLFC